MTENRTYKVLYVEDSEQLADLCIAALGQHGYEVITTATCAEGRTEYSARNYVLILLDYNLPDGDGLSLAQEIIANDVDTPIILITAQGSEKIAANALGIGIAAYVIKGGRDVYTEILPNVIGKTISQAEALLQAKHLQQEIVSQEANLQAFLNAIKDRAILMDEDGLVFAANNALAEVFEVPLDQIIGQNIYSFDNPISAERRRLKIKTVLETGEPLVKCAVPSSRDDGYIES